MKKMKLREKLVKTLKINKLLIWQQNLKLKKNAEQTFDLTPLALKVLTGLVSVVVRLTIRPTLQKEQAIIKVPI